MNDPLDSAIPVGSGSGTTPSSSSTPPPSSPPPPAAASTSMAPSGTDKIWAILSHVSGFLGVPFILPLVIYLAMKKESAYVASNAREALNFHLSLIIYGIGCGLVALTVIGLPVAVILCAILAIASLVFSIIAAIRANEGSVYVYPLSLRLIK